MRFDSLKYTLLFSYGLVGFLPLLLFTNIIFHTIDNYLIQERQNELLSQANMLAGKITTTEYLTNPDKELDFDQSIQSFSEKGQYRVIVIDASGVVVKDSNRQEEGKTYLIPEVVEALDNKDVARRQPNGTVYAAASILNNSDKKIGAVLIAAPTTDVSNTVGDIKKDTSILFVAMGILVGVIMFFMAQLFTEPLKKMLQVIIKMSEGHLDQRIEVNKNRHNEITNLALACNNMVEKLQRVETTREHFVSNVSHELKTPLSSIKVLSESILLQEDVPQEMYQEFLLDINSEVDRMTEIINDLLTLVKLDQKEIPISFVETDLNKLMSDIMKRLMPLAQAKELSLELELVREVKVDMDEMKMSLALSNLVDNAIKYTPNDGKVKVTVDADHQNAFVRVVDTGIGIGEEELGKIFDRFYRVDKTRDRETGGTGLGLSITHSTILMHHGSIKVSSKEKEGTTFLVRIPLHQST